MTLLSNKDNDEWCEILTERDEAVTRAELLSESNVACADAQLKAEAERDEWKVRAEKAECERLRVERIIESTFNDTYVRAIKDREDLLTLLKEINVQIDEQQLRCLLCGCDHPFGCHEARQHEKDCRLMAALGIPYEEESDG